MNDILINKKINKKMNTLSVFGRMSYGAHMVTTGLLVGTGYFGGSAYMKYSAESMEKQVQESLPKLRKVDPDLFNPFTPIPFHNNPESKYRFADMKLHGYLDAKTHMNLKDYAYKGFNDSFDHGDKK